MRHAVGIFAIIAIVSIAGLLLSVSYNPEPTHAAISLYSPTSQPEGNTVVVLLDVNEYIGNEVEALTENQLSYLRNGVIHAKNSKTEYAQNLVFQDPGQFMGGKIVFGRTENREVTDFLEFDDSIFELKIIFEQGLNSRVDGSQLPDIESEDIEIMGSRFAIIDTNVNPSSGRVSLKLFGGFGSVEFEDDNFRDSEFQQGAKINGQYVNALVRIRAAGNENSVSIYSIEYILNADSVYGGSVQVLPLHCVREFLQYPAGMLVPNFDICYKGLGGTAEPSQQSVSSNRIFVRASGDDEYVMTATNNYGRSYPIPLAQLPGDYGNRGRNLVFVEAPNSGAPNINLGDYFLVNSKNDINGVSAVLRYNSQNPGRLDFTDLAGDSKTALYDLTTGEGQLLVGAGTYRFVVGPGGSIAMDQNNDGQINGGEARFVVMGGILLDLGPGFTIKVIVPQRLFSDPMGDEITDFDILFGSQIDLFVPTPQGEMQLQSLSGRKQGMTRYGVFFDWDTSDTPGDLTIAIPGVGGAGGIVSVGKGNAQGGVFISLERERLMKKPSTEVPAPAAKCGDQIITKPEYCDPPGSICTRSGVQKGVCSNDCMSCNAQAVCGNNLIEPGEDCEKDVDCAGLVCSNCKCVKPPAVCGNNLLEAGEQCEKDVDCPSGQKCANCACFTPPPVITICQFPTKCRIWDARCGEGLEMLMEDSAEIGCVDAFNAASEGVGYCGKYTLVRGNVACNYQDRDPGCVCASLPELQSPSFVATPSVLTRMWWSLRNFFRPVAVVKVG